MIKLWEEAKENGIRMIVCFESNDLVEWERMMGEPHEAWWPTLLIPDDNTKTYFGVGHTDKEHGKLTMQFGMCLIESTFDGRNGPYVVRKHWVPENPMEQPTVAMLRRLIRPALSDD